MRVGEQGGTDPYLSQEDKENIGLNAAFVGETLDNLLKRLGESTLPALLAIGDKIFKGKMTIPEALGLEPEQIEGVYGMAYQLFMAGQYSEAEKIFTVLMLLDPENGRYTEGYANSLHRQKKWMLADGAYTAARIIDPKNPALPFQQADTKIQQEQYLQAHKLLQEAIKLAGKDPGFEALVSAAEQMLQNIADNVAAQNLMDTEAAQEIRQEMQENVQKNDTISTGSSGDGTENSVQQSNKSSVEETKTEEPRE